MKKKINKKIIGGILLLDLILIILVMAITFGSATRYEYYNPSRTTNDNFNNDTWNAQTFKVGTNGTNELQTLKGVSLVIYGQPTVEANLTIGIRAVNSSGGITGVDLTNATINITTVPADYTWTNISFEGHEYNLLAGTSYALVVRTNKGGAGVGIGMGGAGLGYYGGNKSISTNVGNSWTLDGTNDFLFEIWGITYGGGIPTITLNNPNNNTLFSKSVTFNCSAISDISTMVNLTLYINDILNKTITNETANVNLSLQSINNLDYGNYNWSCVGVDNEGDIGNSSIRVFKVGEWLEESKTYNSSTYETSSETFKINITGNGSQTLSANLIYDGTSYSTTKTGDNYNAVFSKTLDISEGLGNNTFYWNISYGNSITSTSNYLQDVFESKFTLCNSTYTVPYINFTFKDEADESIIKNVTIPSSTFVYWLGSGVVNKTYSFSNNSANNNYTFCFSPSSKTINVDYSIQYKDFEGDYPQRIYEPDTETLTNSTTNKILYLLGTADGLYVTIQVINQNNQLLSGVEVISTRLVNGVTTTVGTGTTGADGSVTFWLNPDYSHTFTFAKSGYTTLTESFFPTQSSYTVTLAGGTEPEVTDYTRGIDIIIKPIKDTTLYNNTEYNFNMTISTGYATLDNWGFKLRLLNGTILTASNSTNSDGGIVTTNLNTGNYSRIFMDYYWTINSTTLTRTTYWNILDTGYEGFSIKHFFTDLNNYLDSGLFGIDDFGKHLLIYFIIFIFIGVMSYKFGLTSPISISAMIFAVIYFFDVVTNMMPSIAGIPNGFTWMAGLIMAVLVIKEATS